MQNVSLHPTPGYSRAIRIALVLAALVAAALALASRARADSRPRQPLLHLTSPDNLATTTRAELRARMNRHSGVMSSLVRAVVLLDRPTIATMATRIADEEMMARTESRGLDEWRPLLPKAFFVEQDALRSEARDLAQAAAEGQPNDALAERFGVLTRTCVRCHGSYLHDQPAGPLDPDR